MRDAAGQDAQRFEALRRREPLLHAPFVQHGLAQHLLVKADVAEDDRDLIAERDVGVVSVLMIERDHAQQLLVVNQRKHEQRVLPFQLQDGGRDQLARREPGALLP